MSMDYFWAILQRQRKIPCSRLTTYITVGMLPICHLSACNLLCRPSNRWMDGNNKALYHGYYPILTMSPMISMTQIADSQAQYLFHRDDQRCYYCRCQSQKWRRFEFQVSFGLSLLPPSTSYCLFFASDGNLLTTPPLCQ